MSVVMMVFENLPYFAAGGGFSFMVYSGCRTIKTAFKGRTKKQPEPTYVEGRTYYEWYTLIKNMGKETFERMALGPLDGLERSTEYGWDYKRLLGPRWEELEREWYPERYPEPVKVSSDRITVRSGKVYLTPTNTVNVSYNYNKDTVTVDSKAPVYNKPRPKNIWEGFFDDEKDELDKIGVKIARLERELFGEGGSRERANKLADSIDKDLDRLAESPSKPFGPPPRKVQFKHMFGEMHQVFHVYEHKVALSRKQVQTLQWRLGITADGLVGPDTILRAQNRWLDDPGFKQIFGGYGVRVIR